VHSCTTPPERPHQMATTRGNPDQYLQKVGGTYYARVRVPRTLEKYVGQTHLRRSLETGDRAEANRRKHAVVGKLKTELEKLRKTPEKTKERGISFSDAKEWREGFKELEAAGDHHNLEEMTLLATDKAAEVEKLYGFEKAKKWYRSATVTTETLSELMTKYLENSDYKESTKHGHKKALEDVLGYLKDPEAHPQDITRKAAIKYIDEDLTQRRLAHNTIRDRLVSLGGFWKWMASRGAVPEDTNPWSNHKLSKTKNKGTRPPKRAYTDDELLALLKGTEETKKWPTYSYLPDLIVLGMFTGCREEELCCLQVKDIEKGKDHFIINVTDAKTKAGIRPVAVTHPAPMAVLKRRMAAKGERLFAELKPGGLDDKYSASAVKAYGRYRRACGVPDGTDYHSFRRNVITVLERAKVGQVEIARYVGHNVGTLAADTYSGGADVERSLEVSRHILYDHKVEAMTAKLSSTS
jgi:integrase